MKIIDTIREEIRPVPVRLASIEAKCIKFGLDAQAPFTGYDARITKVVIELLVQAISLKSVDQGGVNMSFDTAKIEKRIKSLCLEIGADASDYIDVPTITRIE